MHDAAPCNSACTYTSCAQFQPPADETTPNANTTTMHTAEAVAVAATVVAPTLQSTSPPPQRREQQNCTQHHRLHHPISSSTTTTNSNSTQLTTPPPPNQQQQHHHHTRCPTCGRMYFLTSCSFCCASDPATTIRPSLEMNQRNFSNQCGLRATMMRGGGAPFFSSFALAFLTEKERGRESERVRERE